MRRAAAKDRSKDAIVAALRSVPGVTVYDLKLPVDLLIGYGGRTILAELKDGYVCHRCDHLLDYHHPDRGACTMRDDLGRCDCRAFRAKPPSKRKYTKLQRGFIETWQGAPVVKIETPDDALRALGLL